MSCQRPGELAGQQTGCCCLWPSVCKTACLLRVLIPVDGAHAHAHAPSAQTHQTRCACRCRPRCQAGASDPCRYSFRADKKKFTPGVHVSGPYQPLLLPHSILNAHFLLKSYLFSLRSASHPLRFHRCGSAAARQEVHHHVRDVVVCRAAQGREHGRHSGGGDPAAQIQSGGRGLGSRPQYSGKTLRHLVL